MQQEQQIAGVGAQHKPRRGVIGVSRVIAIRRRAMKRWLRAKGITIPARSMYNETALRKMVRTAIAKTTVPSRGNVDCGECPRISTGCEAGKCIKATGGAA